MQISVYNVSGEEVRKAELDDSVFAVPFNEAVVHQAMVRQNANARQGTSNTKTRGQVKGSARKLFRQKGTGNARAGTVKSPLRRGGGVVFGPHPRSYRQDMPKKMRRLAIRCLLSAKAANGELKVLDELSIEEPKTKIMAGILDALKVETSALVATEKPQDSVVKAARNLQKVKTTPANLINVGDLLKYRTLVMTEEAIRQIEGMWGLKQGETENASV